MAIRKTSKKPLAVSFVLTVAAAPAVACQVNNVTPATPGTGAASAGSGAVATATATDTTTAVPTGTDSSGGTAGTSTDAGASATTSTDDGGATTASGQALPKGAVIARGADGTCILTLPMCGPTCNPPPPHKITCPASLPATPVQGKLEVAASGTCTFSGDVSCAPHVACNPPGPQTVTCPTL
jgi:hypothetical protein